MYLCEGVEHLWYLAGKEYVISNKQQVTWRQYWHLMEKVLTFEEVMDGSEVKNDRVVCDLKVTPLYRPPCFLSTAQHIIGGSWLFGISENYSFILHRMTMT